MNKIIQLRRMLEGVRWHDFNPKHSTHPSNREEGASAYRCKNTVFYAKYGLFMQRPCVAIVSRGCFIQFTQVEKDGHARFKHEPILPTAQYASSSQVLYRADFAPYRMALVRLDGSVMQLDDFVLTELAP